MSLDLVSLTMFNGAFTMNFDRLSGVPGNENGAVTYIGNVDSFWLANYDPTGTVSLGMNVFIPSLLPNASYEYVVTGNDSAKLTITYDNVQGFPTALYNPANPAGNGDLFWNGVLRDSNTVVFDLLFTNNGGVLSSLTTNVDFINQWHYLFNTNPAFWYPDRDDPYTPYTVNTSTAAFTLQSTGGYLPAGYSALYGRNGDGYDQDNWVSPIVWTHLDADAGLKAPGSVTFWYQAPDMPADPEDPLAVDLTTIYKFAFTAGRVDLEVPGADRNDEEGSVLVNIGAVDINTVEPTLNAQWEHTGIIGTYAYARIGAADARLVVSFSIPGVGPVVKVFDMNFDTADGGVTTDELGIQGYFEKQFFNTTL